MKTKIILVEPVTHDVKRFVVRKPQGYKFTPGQATEVAIDKPDWINQKRPFTFTSLNSYENLEFIIKGYPLDKYPNHTGMTEKMHKLKTGDELLIDSPWGAIKYKEKGVFIAGGAGITPFIAILRQLEKEDKLKGNKLLFSNKTKKDIILENELKEMFTKGEDLILTLTKEENDNYKHGRIDREFLKSNIDNFNQSFYVCGPKEMVRDINIALNELGTSADSIVFEK